MKNVAKTFITRAAQLRFVTNYLSTHSSQSVEPEASEPCPLKCSTMDAANALYSKLSKEGSHGLKETGILIGSGKVTTLSTRQTRDIKHWVLETTQANLPDDSFPQIAQSFSKILVPNKIDVPSVYRVGDTVIIKDAYADDSEWISEITSIILYGPVENKYFTFVDGKYYAPQVIRGVFSLESWTKQPKLCKCSYANLCVQKASLIESKVMLYPDPHNRDRPSYFLAIDTESYIQPSPITIPTP